MINIGPARNRVRAHLGRLMTITIISIGVAECNMKIWKIIVRLREAGAVKVVVV